MHIHIKVLNFSEIPVSYMYMCHLSKYVSLYFRMATMMQDNLQILDELLKKGYDRRATPTNHLSKYLLLTLYRERNEIV